VTGAAGRLRKALARVAIALAIALAAGLSLAGAASAHQQKAAITEVSASPRTGLLEIAHRFYIHDAEHALGIVTGRPVNLHAEAGDRDLFAAAVAGSFALTRPDGGAVALVLLGTEVERGYLWVYQEGPADALTDGLEVRADALRDVWPEQVNTVNIRTNAGVTSLQFQGAAQTLRARLPQDGG
jgi:hypothetical protein